VSHTPQLVRGYPCTGPCSPEVAEVLQSHRRRSFGASHTAHRLDNRPSCHKHERKNDAHWTLWKVVDFALVSSFRQTRRPIKPRFMRHSIYHEDASPPRPTYGFKVYCSCTGTVVAVGTLTANGQDVHSGYAAQQTSHPRHFALEVKRPRGENDHSSPPSRENEWSYTPTSPQSSWRTQDHYAVNKDNSTFTSFLPTPAQRI